MAAYMVGSPYSTDGVEVLGFRVLGSSFGA